MNKHFYINFLLIIVIVFLSGCNPLKKNVMKDNADDVEEMIISKSDAGTFLVSKEEVFQATSKSDNGGIRQITGYVEYRLSSHDLNTGNLSKRVVLGDRKENGCEFLGETNGKIWYKSVDPKLGFYAREPKNLDVVITQDKIIEVNPFLKDNLSQPDALSINRYYGFDINKKTPLVSDNSGYVYSIDPVTLKAEKTSESIKSFNHSETCTGSSMKIDVNTIIYLRGTPRSHISYLNKEVDEPSFLKGNFLKSSNAENVEDSDPELYAPYKKEIEKYNYDIDSLTKFIEETDTIITDKTKKIFAKHYMDNAKRSIQDLHNKIKYTMDRMGRNSTDSYFEIITTDNGVFVLSQNDVTDKAKVVISKVILNSDGTITQSWQNTLNDFYRDPDKGFDKSSFEVVFSKGSPDLRTMRVVSGEGKLIFMFMLKAVCIDQKTGIIIWNIDM